MSRGVNKVFLVGNLGKDPEIRNAANGSNIVNIVIATSESWKDKQTGEKQEKTEWHRVVFFGRLADIASQYLKKGNQVYVEGRLQTSKWQGQDGQDRFTTEVVANNLEMLGSRSNVVGNSSDDSWGKPDSSEVQPDNQVSNPSGDDMGDVPF